MTFTSKARIPHNTPAYAKVRIRNLEARIKACEAMPPDQLYAKTRGRTMTVARRLRLDRAVLANWKERLRIMEAEGK